MPTNQPPRPAQILRLVGFAEIALGLALLIAGFAADLMVLVIVGVVLVASSGTLFVFSRSLARQHGPTDSAHGEQPPPRWPPE